MLRPKDVAGTVSAARLHPNSPDCTIAPLNRCADLSRGLTRSLRSHQFQASTAAWKRPDVRAAPFKASCLFLFSSLETTLAHLMPLGGDIHRISSNRFLAQQSSAQNHRHHAFHHHSVRRTPSLARPFSIRQYRRTGDMGEYRSAGAFDNHVNL